MWYSLLLLGTMLAGQAPAAEESLKIDVRRLVRQLDAPKQAERDAAEDKLIELGPPVLDLLPATSDRTSAEVRQRLDRIRQRLQKKVAESYVQGARVTLHDDAIPLSKALAAIQEQTGNRIVDFRKRFGQERTDPKIKVDLEKKCFWQSLDEVLDQAGMTVYPSAEDRVIAFVHRSQGQLKRVGRASYAGPFRVEPIVVATRRDLRARNGDSLILTLEVAWEPRITPISLKQVLSQMLAVDDKDNRLSIDASQAELEVAANPLTTAAELPVPLALPPRSVQEITRLEGMLTVMIPGKVETFRFDKLDAAKNVEQKQAGVTVTLEETRMNNEVFEVRMRAAFDDPGKALESHRGWVLQNEAYLEGPDGKPIPYDSLETTRQTENEIGVAYLFAKPPAGAKFVYKTPGVIVATGFPYKLKGIKLP